MARCTELGVDPLPERLKGDLQNGTRILNLELLEDRGEQNAGAAVQGGLDAPLDCRETVMFLGGWCRTVVDCRRTTREYVGPIIMILSILERYQNNALPYFSLG